MHDYLIYTVMGLLALLGVLVAVNKPKHEAGERWRYIMLGLVVVAEVVCLLLVVGVLSLLFGGC